MRTDDLEIVRYNRQPVPTVRDLVALLFRQRLPLLIAFVVALLVVGLSGFWSPQYDAQMKILVQHNRWGAMIASSPNAPQQYGGDAISEEDLNSEVELLNSQDLLRTVVLTAGLTKDPKNEVQTAKAIRSLGKNLKIEPLLKSDVISVKYENRDPRMAARVLQSLATAYNQKHLKLQRSSGEVEFLDQQVKQFHDGLDLAQEQLAGFNTKSGVISAGSQRDSALQETNNFEAAAHQAQASLLETEQRVRTLSTQLQSMNPRVTTAERTSEDSVLLQQLKSTLLNLQLKKTELLTKYEPTQRLVQQVNQQIAETQSAIKTQESEPSVEKTTDQNPDYQWVQGELTKARTDLTALKARAAATTSIAGNYEESARRLDQDNIVQQNLLQAVQTQKDNYLLYTHKLEEAKMNQALDQSGILNVAIAEKPSVPALPSRSPLGVAIVTLLIAGIFSLFVAFIADFMDPSFRTPDELANYLEMPVLAALLKESV